jgi:hypothetical protein
LDVTLNKEVSTFIQKEVSKAAKGAYSPKNGYRAPIDNTNSSTITLMTQLDNKTFENNNTFEGSHAK